MDKTSIEMQLHALDRATLARLVSQALHSGTVEIVWTDRERMLDVFERLPQTFCHLDAWRKNLFAPPEGGRQNQVIVIDWSYVGKGTIATDAADLAGASFGLFGVEACEPHTFATEVFENYLEGLQEAGWQGKRSTVHFAFTALKYGCLLAWLRDVSDESKYVFWENLAGHLMDEFLHQEASWILLA